MARRRETFGSLLALGLFTCGMAQAQFERAPDPPAEETTTDRPKVALPQLKHFAQATYPTAASNAGLTADVVMRLTIDAEGVVTEAEIIEPAGHGFDEAAREAALKFAFEPATRDGVAVKARILYRYSFTLVPVSKPALDPPKPLTTGVLAGVLRIAETESPLAGAEVVVVTTSGVEVRQTSDAAGRFAFDGLLPGRYRVRLRSPGFRPTEETETVVVGEATEVLYRVAAAGENAEGGAIEVTVQGERPPREVTRRTLERREVDRIPGTSGDALRSIESLPGVARPPAIAGILVVRGSYPEDTHVYVDGSLIPLVYHFGGLRSVLPTELLERIDFFPGNYGAKFGRGMGGIVDVSLKSPETRCKDKSGNLAELRGCFHGLAQVDFIEGRLLLQGPTPVKGWSFAIGGRRSWLDAWIGPVLEDYGANVKSLPVYDDYQVILERRLSSDSRLSFRLFGSHDSFAAVVDPLAQEPAFGGNFQFATSFIQGQVLHEQQLNSRLRVTTLLTQGKTNVDFRVGSVMVHMESHPFHWREELGIRLSKGLRINAGLDFQVYPHEITARSPAPPEPGQPTSGPFSTRPMVEVSQSVTGLNEGLYADAELQPTERLRVVPGLRVDYTRETRKLDTDPRVTVRYDLVQGGTQANGQIGRRTTVKGGAGYYSQAPQSREVNSAYGTPGLRSNRALSFALGLEQELTRNLDASVEGFYKDYDNLVATGKVTDQVRYTNDGFGKSYGLETLLRYKPDRHFFGWVAYTLSRSERQDYSGDEPYLIPYDQTHNLTVLGSYRLGRGWEFGARFRVISGSLITPVRAVPALPAIFSADSGAYVPFQGEPFSERLPLFHQLDLRLDKRWQTESFRISTYLDVYNVYNKPAVEGMSYDYNYAHRNSLVGIPFLPSVGVRGEF